jgi:hypothetical protein
LARTFSKIADGSTDDSILDEQFCKIVAAVRHQAANQGASTEVVERWTMACPDVRVVATVIPEN